MPSRNPPASTRRGKGFTKAETTTLLKAVERILPIDAEGWTEVHEIFNSKGHSPRHLDFEVLNEIEPNFFLFGFPQQSSIS